MKQINQLTKQNKMVLLLISVVISIFIANIYHKMVPYQAINELRIEVSEETNESSRGHFARIYSIKAADGSYVDLKALGDGDGWKYGVDENILGYYGEGRQDIAIPMNTNLAVISMIKTVESGFVDIFVNDDYYKTIDLYAPKWTDAMEVVHGRPNVMGMLLAFIVSFVATMGLLLMLFYRVVVKKEVTIFDFLPGLVVSVSLAGLICIYAPLELYFTNIGDFWYDSSLLLPAAAELFFLCVILLLALYCVALFINMKVYRILVLISFTALIAMYIQGNFLTGDLPPMDGTIINWNDFTTNNIVSAAIFLFIGCVVGIVTWKISIKTVYNLISIISGGLFLMLMCTILVLCISKNGLENKSNMKATTANEFVMSTNKNLIIFLLDAVDSHTFWKVLEDNPEYKKNFDDFTYYPNTLGAYSFTSRSIPFILSGKWFENEEPFERYQTKALKDSPLFGRLEEYQYSIGIYDQYLNMNMDVGLDRFENQVEIKQQTTSWKNFLYTYLGMGGVKFAPYNLKQLCYEIIDRRESLLLSDENIDGNRNFAEKNTEFYNSLREQGFQLTDKNVFKFFHFEGAHVPYRYNKDLEVVENATYEMGVEACITLMNTYLDSLKKMGLYDNTSIVFLSDHGYWQDIYNPDGVLEIRQNPLLLIKGFNEAHDFQMSNAPISFHDLQTAYTNLLEGKQGDKVFGIKEGDERERRYLYYLYLEEHTMKEYVQTGDVWQPGSIQPTGKEFNQ